MDSSVYDYDFSPICEMCLSSEDDIIPNQALEPGSELLNCSSWKMSNTLTRLSQDKGCPADLRQQGWRKRGCDENESNTLFCYSYFYISLCCVIIFPETQIHGCTPATEGPQPEVPGQAGNLNVWFVMAACPVGEEVLFSLYWT